MSILEIIGLVWITILIWNFLTTTIRSYREVAQDQAQVRSLLEKTINNTVREVYFDVVNTNDGTLFLVYDAKTKEFIGQGRSQAEVVENLKSRFPNKIFTIDTGSTWNKFQVDQ